MRVALAALIAAAGLAQAAPVAFVADIRGNATIEGDGKLDFLAEIEPGTRLLLGSGATASITYVASGSEFTIAGPGEFLVAAAEVKAEKGGPPRKRMVAKADPAIVGEVSKSATASLRMRSLSTPARGSGEGRLEALSPEVKARVEKSKSTARTFSDRVLHAILLQQVGATHEAREAWAALARERPDLPQLAALAR
jgi:hypothetical protein